MKRPELVLRDFCIPVNPYFPTAGMFAKFHEQLETGLKYYPADNAEIAHVLAEVLGLDPASVVMANGSTELITWICELLVRGGLATPVPTFGRWTDQPRELGQAVHEFPLRAEDGFRLAVDRFVRFVRRRGAAAAAICNPNNPTGSLVPREDLQRLLEELSDLDVVVIDESFIDFAEPDDIPSAASAAAARPGVIVIKSLGKNFGLHGVRAGYAVAHPRTAELLRRRLPPWNINALAEMLVRALPDHWAEYEQSRRHVIRDRLCLHHRLARLPQLVVFPSKANFVYVRIPQVVDGVQLRNRLLTEYGILVRECGSKSGSDRHHLRIAARPETQLDQLTTALAAALEELGSPRDAKAVGA
jgi:histidinol-phosphate/aromatic aminotransferase/cobyric acid decarboxylase-like protein